MKCRPIILSAPMVRAVLEDRKSQTRRVVKPQPIWIAEPDVPFKTEDADPQGVISCPYGITGDGLWARETYSIIEDRVAYKADEVNGVIPYHYCLKVGQWKWKSPISMPRWASRILLEVTDVRVERLQDISAHDALREGVGHDGMGNPVVDFQNLWEKINGPGSWAANPWVWVVGFRRVNADALAPRK